MDESGQAGRRAEAQFRFHVVGLPHTVTSRQYVACAYTQKVYKFCRLMREAGHEVFHYGAEASDPPCTEHVDVISREEQERFFGEYDWRREFFRVQWDPALPYWQLTNARAAHAVRARSRPRDFLCLIAGTCQFPIAGMVGDHVLPVEYGVGYAGIASRFRVFESYAQMHLVYGMRGGDALDGSFYDAVIPNSYDPADFPFQEQKEDYLLFMGRLVRRKGPHVAAEVARRAGMPLVVAGQGGQQEGTRIIAGDVVVDCPGLRYEGVVDREKRGLLMSRARAVIAPTLYVEPFGGVAAEAQLCGTPVITTDWGAFTETVLHGRTGYRCRTLEQFTWAARNTQRLSPRVIRRSAVRRFSLARAARMYGEYFRMLADLWGDGWYTEREREDLDWLNDGLPAPLSGEGEKSSGPRG